nr:hypothetical protein [Tanacetum cinerariifolium]
MSSPPASPLSPWSSPPPWIPFTPLPLILSPLSPVLSQAPPPSPIRSLGYRAAMIRLQAEAASTSYSPPLPPLLLPISASTSSPPLQPPSARESLSVAARPAGGHRANYDFVATMGREIIRDPKREVGYGITDSWDEIVETLQGAPVSTDAELGGYMREFETRVRQDTKEIYMRLDDEQSERHLLASRLNKLFRDRRAHAYKRHLMETEVRMSREAWKIYRDYRVEDSPTGTGDSHTGTGSPRADDHEHLKLPEMLEDPYVEVALQARPSPDYIPGPEELEQAPPSPDYVPGP